MKIVVVGNFALDAQESMLRFSRTLADGLDGRGHIVTVLSPGPVFARLARHYRYQGVPKYLGYLDKFMLFPRKLRGHVDQHSPEIVHIVDHANAAYGAHGG